MDLNTIFTKTAKATRTSMLWGGGLSSEYKRVLSQVDGMQTVDDIFRQSEKMTKNELQKVLLELEKDGYIHRLSHHEAEPEWLRGVNTYPISSDNNYSIAVEELDADEFNFDETTPIVKPASDHSTHQPAEDHIKVDQENKAKEELALKTKREAERKAQAEAAEKVRREAAAQAKRIAEVETKARQEIERIEREKAKLTAKAQAEERKAKAEAEKQAQEQAALKARADAAEQARLEAERVAQEQAEALAKVEAERKVQAQLAAKAQQEIEQKARLEAERVEREKSEAIAKAKLEEEARLQAERKAQAEAEEKARVEAELKARVEAAEQARLEAERIAHEQAETLARIEADRKAMEKVAAKARQEAEAQARLDAERKEQEKAEAAARAKAEAEEKARAEAELKARVETAEQARLEAERVAHEQAEALARMEAERKVQEETAAQARLEAEQQARLDAERMEREKAEAVARARQEAEEQARAEAERQQEAFAEAARIEAERIAQETLAAKAKLETEEARLKEVAERNASAVAEVEANTDAAEQARLEAERIAREEAEEKAWLEAERVAREQADDFAATTIDNENEDEKAQARVQAERKALAEAAEEAMHKAENLTREDVEAVREELQRAAAQEKKAKTRFSIKEYFSGRLTSGRLMSHKWMAKSMSSLAIAVPATLVLLLVLVHFVNLGMLIKPIERLASASVGEPVTVREVHAALFPQPKLVLADVSVGDTAAVKIGAVHILSGISMLFDDVKNLESIEVRNVTLQPADVGRQMQWVNHAAKADKLKIGQITLKEISFQIPGLEPESFDGKLIRTASGELSKIELVNASRNLTLLLVPQSGSCDLTLTAIGWQPPQLKPLELDEITATGRISQYQASFNQIEAKAYGGTIKAQGMLDWSGRLHLSGNLELIKATLPRLLTAFGSGASVDGTLNVKAAFVSNADQPSALVQAAEINANFEVQNGRLNGIALSHAVMSGPASKPLPEADFTRFDTLAGNLQFKDGLYRYRELELKTDQFRARGLLDIMHDQMVTGKISAELMSKTVRRQASFNVSGTPADIRLQ